MATRVQGGTNGLLAAIFSGRLDPYDGDLPEDRPAARLSNSDWRCMAKRERRRRKCQAMRDRLVEPPPF